MSTLTSIANFLTGGFGEKIVEGIQAYFPPSLSDAEKANIELALKQQIHAATMDLQNAAQAERQQFDDRVKQLEGTASDLARFGWLGSIIMFLRGCQRPVWGYLTLYMDLCWFSGKWGALSSQQESAFWIVNLLVLGFLFGERAIKNLMPLITEFMKQRSSSKGETWNK
ncbi:MAG: hypothetical protein ACKVI8_07115 [Paraglaciecola sp.]